MADQLPRPDTGAGPDRGSNTGTPRWVKVFGVIVVVLVLLFLIMHLVTGGGLGRHTPGAHTPSSSVTQQGLHQP